MLKWLCTKIRLVWPLSKSQTLAECKNKILSDSTFGRVSFSSNRSDSPFFHQIFFDNEEDDVMMLLMMMLMTASRWLAFYFVLNFNVYGCPSASVLLWSPLCKWGNREVKPHSQDILICVWSESIILIMQTQQTSCPPPLQRGSLSECCPCQSRVPTSSTWTDMKVIGRWLKTAIATQGWPKQYVCFCHCLLLETGPLKVHIYDDDLTRETSWRQTSACNHQNTGEGKVHYRSEGKKEGLLDWTKIQEAQGEEESCYSKFHMETYLQLTKFSTAAHHDIGLEGKWRDKVR